MDHLGNIYRGLSIAPVSNIGSIAYSSDMEIFAAFPSKIVHRDDPKFQHNCVLQTFNSLIAFVLSTDAFKNKTKMILFRNSVSIASETFVSL